MLQKCQICGRPSDAGHLLGNAFVCLNCSNDIALGRVKPPQPKKKAKKKKAKAKAKKTASQVLEAIDRLGLP